MVRTGIAALLARAHRPGALILILFAFASCAPVLAPRGISYGVPTVAGDAFVTRDGIRLPLRHWDAQKPQAIIVALHGMSDYSQAFDLPAPWWAAHGVSVYAYDQRGFGAAPNAGLWAGARAMRDDLDDFVEAMRAKFPGVPVYALGESMGGSVVLTALASAHPPRVDGVILVAPAVWSREDMPFIYSVVLWTTAHIVPSMHVSGEGLHILATNNFPVLRKLAHDPLYQHSARVDQVYGLVNLMSEARDAPQHLTATPPILFLYGGNDQVIPAAPTQTVASELGSKATVIRYPNGYHMLLRDLEGPARWADILAWIGKTNSARDRQASQTEFSSGKPWQQRGASAVIPLGRMTE